MSALNKPRHAPNTIWWRSSALRWNMICPNTGDWIYEGERQDGRVMRCIVTNPDAPERQRARLTR